MKIKRLRKKTTGKNYIEKRILKLSREIDRLNGDIFNPCYYDSITQDYILIERGDFESEAFKIINEKKIKRLKNKIDFYKKKNNL